MYQSFQLTNGARVILAPKHDTTSITTLVLFPIGSRYEPEPLSGVSHYIEHLMFKGTKQRKNTLTLTREIDRLGAEYNAFTSKEYTIYYIKADARYAEVCFDILSDMLFSSLFDPSECEREKGPIIEEIRMYKDNPIMHIDDLFEQLLYTGSVGRSIAGTEAHIRSFRRDRVLAFRDRYYHPKNMWIVVSGNVTEETIALIHTFFELEKGPKRCVSLEGGGTFEKAGYGSSHAKDRLMVEERRTDQAQMTIGFPGFPYGDSRMPALTVLNTILGGSMSSRLFIRIRERLGLAYSVKSETECFRDAGYAAVRVGLAAEHINKAIRAIRRELLRLVDTPVSSQELSDAKTHIRGSLTLTMEDSSAVANWYAKRAVFYSQIETPEEALLKIEAVTKEDIQRLGKALFIWSKVRIAIIGNIKKEQVDF